MTSNVLFKLKNMEIDKIQSFNVEPESQVIINEVIFQKNVISKVEIIKHKFEDENLFIHLYIGNLMAATIVTKNDYVISVDDGPIKDYEIRQAREYDYE